MSAPRSITVSRYSASLVSTYPWLAYRMTSTASPRSRKSRAPVHLHPLHLDTRPEPGGERRDELRHARASEHRDARHVTHGAPAVGEAGDVSGEQRLQLVEVTRLRGGEERREQPALLGHVDRSPPLDRDGLPGGLSS